MKKNIDYDNLKDYKYRVIKTFTLNTGFTLDKPIRTNFSHIDEAGNLTIESGFCWDGASGAVDTDSIMRGSCAHDALCNWMDQGLLDRDKYWKPADELLVRLSEQDGMRDIRQSAVYLAVKAWGLIRYGVR